MLARGKLSLHLGLAVGLVAGLAALGGASGSHAAEISIPNASFEAPAIRLPPYATATIQHWLKAPAPAWWLQEGYTQEDWLTTAGVFYNVPSGTYIDNVDGQQAAFVFSTPGVELYQDLAATYEAGQAYRLTAGFQGGGLGMPLGIPIEIRLYYRDGDGSRVTLGASGVLNLTDESQPHAKHLIDWQVEISPVLAGDAWAGQRIGIQIISNVPYETAGGYWRVDDVRLTSVGVPADFDHDGDVDADDLGFLESCARGPAIAQDDAACAAARLDSDDDVDQADFGLFQQCYSGHNRPADPECLDPG